MIFDTNLSSKEIQDGNFKKVVLENNEEVVVGKKDGKLFAFDNICPHKGASLSKGTLNGDNIVCYMHGYEYNIFNGNLENMKSWKRDDEWIEQNQGWRYSSNLKTYMVFETEGKVFIEIKE